MPVARILQNAGPMAPNMIGQRGPALQRPGHRHLVWRPKYRFQILRGDVGKSMRAIIGELCRQKEIEILEGNVQVDHIHLVASIPPKYSVSYVVGCLKGKSAVAIFDQFVQLKRKYWGRHFWARGYCVGTVGLDEEMIRKYVKWQIKKDKDLEQTDLFEARRH
jgi:putative transposase